MQKLQDSVFSIVKTTNLSPAVFNYLQPSEDSTDKTPLGGILSDTKHGWLALGPKFCVVDLRTGLKIAARTFVTSGSNYRTQVTSVFELPSPLTSNSKQLIISLENGDMGGMICVFHVNGSQILRCIKSDYIVTQLAVYDCVPDGPFTCFDGIVMAGAQSGEVLAFDLNRASLIQALKYTAQGFEDMVRKEDNSTNLSLLPLNAIQHIKTQRHFALENDEHIAVLLNENSLIENQYIFRNPDGTVRMKAKRDHIRVTIIQYIPQLGSLAVGFNFGAFQIWNLLNLDLEFTSQVNVECLPVTQFGFQEPCDDPRAFCYLWVVFSVIDRFDEEEFPLAVLYSFTYQGKRMLSDTKCLYQDFVTATVRFQVELSTTEDNAQLVGGRCISCHTYSVNSSVGSEEEESMLNLCQLVWECWGESPTTSQHGMLLFDLDQWYKDQMPATYRLQSNTFMSATRCTELARGACTTLDVRLAAPSVSVYVAAARLDEHFYPNSLHYECVCLNTSEACVLSTIGIQRQIINSMDEVGPTALLNPTRLYNACLATGLVPLYVDSTRTTDQEQQRRYLLSVALESRLSRLLKRCAHDWCTGSHAGAGCTLPFLVDWCWKRAVELKENARELTSPLFNSSALPDRNVVRCLEHCVQQLTQLTGLLDAILTKCCNMVVPDALSEMEDKFKAIGTVSQYFQVVQWFLRCGLLPERSDASSALNYPGVSLAQTYSKRRMQLQRFQENLAEDSAASKSSPLLYIDQLIEHEFGGDRIHQMWIRGGSDCHGLYPPPSLYALLRLYLLPDVAEQHKHSLVMYLLLDYSTIYDEIRYEAVVNRLKQFPTMFGLSDIAIKATEAFWNLDHRNFDFALNHLQCMTGNTLSEWQHSVVLSLLLAQKKTQAALQYLHVRKPAPVQSLGREDANSSNNRVNDHDKLEDWQSSCNLYLARGLVFEALDVVRMCVQNAHSLEDKVTVLSLFFKGCRNTGHLSKLLQVTLLPFEEDVFIKYLENCNESQTSDILIMYYLQQARYLEAEQYNKKLKLSKPKAKDVCSGSTESLLDIMDRETARDTLVEVMCSALPAIANTVANCAQYNEIESHIMAAKPMSVFVQAKSPKNIFTYKSSFIQDTIENASETWMYKPTFRRGMKRALNVEDTPFICTPKLARNRSIFTMDASESTPTKRIKLDLTGTPKTPLPAFKSEQMSQHMSILLDMPEEPSPDGKLYDRDGAETPQSILKSRIGASMYRCAGAGVPSPPVDSRYLGDSDDELETASNHTHYTDSTNKHLRFTIPTASESGSTPSPPAAETQHGYITSRSSAVERDDDVSVDSYSTTESHPMNEPHPLESPPKKVATEEILKSKKLFKDSVKARRSLSISANSSLTDDPNTSIESIADIPVTLINPRYSGERQRYVSPKKDAIEMTEEGKEKVFHLDVPKTPQGRRSIRVASRESTPLRSRSVTPDRQDSPVVITPRIAPRSTRSKSRTPEESPRSSSLESIQELPKQEVESEPHAVKSTLSIPRARRSRSRTPEMITKLVESPRLEAISESPTKSESPTSSPARRSLRSRSRTPDIEISEKPETESPKPLRRRGKTPEKLMSPKKDMTKSSKKPLSRLVLEANAAKTIQKEMESNTDNVIECTPMKDLKAVHSLMDVTISPIASKSILHSTNESLYESARETKTETSVEDLGIKPLPAFTMNETKFGKSVLNSFESTLSETSSIDEEKQQIKNESKISENVKSLPAFTLGESYFEKSVLKSYQSSYAESSIEVRSMEKSTIKETTQRKETKSSTSMNISELSRSILKSMEDSDSYLDNEPSTSRAMSSLMTSDSDIGDLELKEQWAKTDREAAIIQKAKERINDIENEINEIEAGMSEDDEEDDEAEEERDEQSDQGIDTESEEVEVDDEEEMSEEVDNESSDEAIASEGDIISIADTDDEKNEDENEDAETEYSEEESEETPEGESESDTEDEIPEEPAKVEVLKNKSQDCKSSMQMDVDLTSEEIQAPQINKKENITHVEIDKEGSADHQQVEKEPSVEITDPLNQGHLSLMTEDASEKITRFEIDKEESADHQQVEKEPSVEITDPLNQGHLSLMTEDGSMQEDQPLNLSFDGPMNEVGVQEIKTNEQPLNLSGDKSKIEEQSLKCGNESEMNVNDQPMNLFGNDKSFNLLGQPHKDDAALKTDAGVEMDVVEVMPFDNELAMDLQCSNVLDTSSTIAELISSKGDKDKSQIIKDSQLKHQIEDAPDIDVRSKFTEQADKSDKTSLINEVLEETSTRSRRRAASTSSNKSNTSTKSSKARTKTSKSKEIDDDNEMANEVRSNQQSEDAPDVVARSNFTEETNKNDEKSQINESAVEETSTRPRRRAASTSSNKSNTSTKTSKARPKTSESKEVKIDDKNEMANEYQSKKQSDDAPDNVRSKFTEEANKSNEKSQINESAVEETSTRPRRRAASTSSNKSNVSTKSSKDRSKKSEPMKIDNNETANEEPKTPQTRKRAKSIIPATEEQKTTDDTKPETPSRSRAKTPTHTEVRTIMTRRASRELGLNDSILDESMNSPSTPTRRSTRKQSLNIDDNASIASGSSVRSTRSKADAGASKETKQVKKGRKSVLITKPDLSVIPELTAEESKIEDNSQEKEDIINDYSRTRRLTRNQRSVLVSLMETPPKPSPRRRAASRTSSVDAEDDASSTSGVDAQSMDRIALLNKGDFLGSPDSSEVLSTISPESIASDASKQRRRSRTSRAESDSQPETPKAAKTNRRVSADLAAGSESPGATLGRSRRTSFNKACEAIHMTTPKRRTSTDVRKGEANSAASSPASEEPLTPSRRSRRTSSNYSSATARSRRTPSIDETKDTKKK